MTPWAGLGGVSPHVVGLRQIGRQDLSFLKAGKLFELRGIHLSAPGSADSQIWGLAVSPNQKPLPTPGGEVWGGAARQESTVFSRELPSDETISQSGKERPFALLQGRLLACSRQPGACAESDSHC